VIYTSALIKLDVAGTASKKPEKRVKQIEIFYNLFDAPKLLIEANF
jgi:hypothetical protein